MNASIFDQRLTNLRNKMADTGTDLVAIGPTSHMQWLAGLSPHGDERPVMMLVSQTFAGFLMPSLNADSSRVKTELPFFEWADEEGPDKALATLVSATGINPHSCTVSIDEMMRADFALLLLDALPGATRHFTTDTIGALRATKDQSEYQTLKASALLNDEAVAVGFAALKEGITEKQVARVIRDFYEERGADLQFCIVCFGPNGAYPHHHNSDTALKPGDAVLIDAGCRLDGYPSDMTRVGSFGNLPDGYEEVHGIVEQAVQAACAAARPGEIARDIDKAARDAIAAAGYGDRFLHRTGHGVGIDGHEPPYITATSETVIEEGMVFSIEPGIYLPDRFGVRLEEVVIVRAEGAEILSEMPRDMVRV